MGLPSWGPLTINGNGKLYHKVRQASHFVQMLKRHSAWRFPVARLRTLRRSKAPDRSEALQRERGRSTLPPASAPGPMVCAQARRRTGDCLAAPVSHIAEHFTIVGRNCLPFTLKGLDAMTVVVSNCSMGQSYPSGRCEHCGGLMVLVMPVYGKGPGALRCLECDRIDPLALPSIAVWLVGELRPPR